jgi:N,N'-diacetyllegionaminate synthase
MRLDCKDWPGWPDKRTAIIAEVGINHGGNENLAWEMIQAAHENGADFIKLQTYSTERFFHPNLPYFDNTKSMELSPDATARLFKKAKALGALLISTPFDFESVDLVEAFDPPLYKVASMDNDNYPLIRFISKKRRPTIISCGMASIEEIQRVVAVVEKAGNDKLVLLHCVSDYPADPASLNLNMIPYLTDLINVPVGFSDHAIGMHSSYLAASLGAVVIEKHFTTDRKLEGKIPDADHEISFEPSELRDLRAYCEDIQVMKGVAPREISEGEMNGRKNSRRGIFAKRHIKAGEPLTLSNTIFLRPVGEIPAGHWDQIEAKITVKPIDAMEPIHFSDLGLPIKTYS